ncbi:MAG: hemolysin family protein [bacterium]
MVNEIVALIALLFLSAFFSASEMAFVVSNKIKIELRARKNNISARNAMYFIKEPHNFFSTILILNNIVNISFASIFTMFLIKFFQYGDVTILIISSTLLLLFGELIPKYLAREFADFTFSVSSIPIRIFSFILYPVVKITSSFSHLISNTDRKSTETISHLFDREDIQVLIEEGSEAGHIAEDDSEVISNIIDLGDQKVYEAMTPRTAIAGVEINSTIDEVMKVLIETNYSKLPVYEESLDNIKGIVYARDMFKKPDNLNSILRECIFVPETKKSLDMLNELLEKRISIAIVVDEFGGTAGMITIEDIIEEMFGEIQDEFDVEENICKQVDKFTYILSGKIEIDYLNSEYELNIPEGDYETIGGYITTNLGKIPQRGDELDINHFKIMVLRSDKTKVDLVKLYIIAEKMEE